MAQLESHSSRTQSGTSPGIGSRLHEARVHKGLSLAEVSASIKLKVSFLQALEDDRFEDLPSPFYAKSFLRMYGNHLGLDGAALADEWGNQAEEPEEHQHDPRGAVGYHFTLLVNTVLRHRVSAIVLLVVVVLLFAYCGRGTREGELPLDPDGQGASGEFLREYTPVFDRDEPLPTLP